MFDERVLAAAVGVADPKALPDKFTLRNKPFRIGHDRRDAAGVAGDNQADGLAGHILEYCDRIYLRQLSKEDRASSDLLKRFHQLLRDYYLEERQLDLGVPSVRYCAGVLAYSARYLGDVIHRATGGTAIGYIHSFVVEQGKNLLMNGHNINETAHLLGFDYPHHFTRLFKKVTGITPTDFLGNQRKK